MKKPKKHQNNGWRVLASFRFPSLFSSMIRSCIAKWFITMVFSCIFWKPCLTYFFVFLLCCSNPVQICGSDIPGYPLWLKSIEIPHPGAPKTAIEVSLNGRRSMASMASMPDSPTNRRTITASTEVPLEAEEATVQPAEVWAEKTQEAMDHEKSEEDEKQDTWRMVQVEDVGIFVS
jgi:hypothetical protein